MKLSTLILASTMIVAPASAFAQSQPAPANQSGPNVHPTQGQPTDQGAGNETGNTKTGQGSMSSGSQMKSGTTGAATGGSMSSDKASAPANGATKPDPEAKKQ